MDISKITYLENLKKLSIEQELALILEVNSKPCWMDPIIHYLQEGTLLKDAAEARKLRHQSTLFEVVDGKLYK